MPESGTRMAHLSPFPLGRAQIRDREGTRDVAGKSLVQTTYLVSPDMFTACCVGSGNTTLHPRSSSPCWQAAGKGLPPTSCKLCWAGRPKVSAVVVGELRRKRTGYICKQYQASTAALRGVTICVYRISVYFGCAQRCWWEKLGSFWAPHPTYPGLEQQDCNAGSLLFSDNALGLLTIRRPTSE